MGARCSTSGIFDQTNFKSIDYYKSWLPEFIEKSGTDLAGIREFQTDIFLKPNKQVAAEAHLVDDRGKKYVSKVKF